MAEDFDQERFLTSARCAGMDNVSVYAARGRALSHLADSDLLEGWIEAFRAFAAEPGVSEKGLIESDYKAELDIRGIQAPFDAVAVEMEALSSRILAALQKMEGDDPQRAREMALQMQTFTSAPPDECH